MRFKTKLLVSALLPAIPWLLHGCGGGGDSEAPAAQAPAPVTPPPVASNQAPTLSGQATPQVRVGAAYVFQPTANDADGDSLTFSALNLPPWATLETATGKITGTPGSTDVGTYEAIVITVADATHETRGAPFNITVVGSSQAVVQITWPSPVSKVDGSSLDDLAGFRILYGRSPEDLDHSIWIADPKATSYDIATLDSGDWYFSIVAVNAGGLEGPATTPARKTI